MCYTFLRADLLGFRPFGFQGLGSPEGVDSADVYPAMLIWQRWTMDEYLQVEGRVTYWTRGHVVIAGTRSLVVFGRS